MPRQVKVDLTVTNSINRVINDEKKTTAKSSFQPIYQREE